MDRSVLIQRCATCNGRGSFDPAGPVADPYGRQIFMCGACSATGEILTEAGQIAWREIGGLVERQQRERIEARCL
jgi:hypothetical protein